jgi:hypothetical protein
MVALMLQDPLVVFILAAVIIGLAALLIARVRRD